MPWSLQKQLAPYTQCCVQCLARETLGMAQELIHTNCLRLSTFKRSGLELMIQRAGMQNPTELYCALHPDLSTTKGASRAFARRDPMLLVPPIPLPKPEKNTGSIQ